MNKIIFFLFLCLNLVPIYCYGKYSVKGFTNFGVFENLFKKTFFKFEPDDETCSYTILIMNRAFQVLINDIRNQAQPWIVYADLDKINKINSYLTLVCDIEDLDIIQKGENIKCKACEKVVKFIESLIKSNDINAFEGNYVQGIQLSQKILKLGKKLGPDFRVKLIDNKETLDRVSQNSINQEDNEKEEHELNKTNEQLKIKPEESDSRKKNHHLKGAKTHQEKFEVETKEENEKNHKKTKEKINEIVKKENSKESKEKKNIKGFDSKQINVTWKNLESKRNKTLYTQQQNMVKNGNGQLKNNQTVSVFKDTTKVIKRTKNGDHNQNNPNKDLKRSEKQTSKLENKQENESHPSGKSKQKANKNSPDKRKDSSNSSGEKYYGSFWKGSNDDFSKWSSSEGPAKIGKYHQDLAKTTNDEYKNKYANKSQENKSDNNNQWQKFVPKDFPLENKDNDHHGEENEFLLEENVDQQYQNEDFGILYEDFDEPLEKLEEQENSLDEDKFIVLFDKMFWL